MDFKMMRKLREQARDEQKRQKVRAKRKALQDTSLKELGEKRRMEQQRVEDEKVAAIKVKESKRRCHLQDKMKLLQVEEKEVMQGYKEKDYEGRQAFKWVREEVANRVGFPVEVTRYRRQDVCGVNYFMQFSYAGFKNKPKQLQEFFLVQAQKFGAWMKEVARHGDPAAVKIAEFLDSVDEQLCALLGDMLDDPQTMKDMSVWFKLAKWDFPRHMPVQGVLPPNAKSIVEAMMGLHAHYRAVQGAYEAANLMKCGHIRVHVDTQRRHSLHSFRYPKEPEEPIEYFDDTHRDHEYSGDSSDGVSRWGPHDVGGPRDLMPVLLGSTMRIKHLNTQKHLHSHRKRYTHHGSSREQQVTCFAGRDTDDLWVVVAQHGRKTRVGRTVRVGSVIQLRHRESKSKVLTCNGSSASPHSKMFEVACVSPQDSNSNWRVECDAVRLGATLTTGLVLRFIHLNTGLCLYSHDVVFQPVTSLLEQSRQRLKDCPESRITQQEVVAYGGRDRNDYWTIDEVAFDTLDPQKVSDMGFSNPKLDDVVASLKGKHCMPSVKLDGLYVGDEGMAQIASAMFIDSKIKEFWLRRCAIGNIGMQALRDALMFNKVAIKFHLDGNEISDDGAQILADALTYNNRVREVELSQNQIGNRGATALATALRRNKGLTILDLNDNKITDTGGTSFARALRDNKAVTYLGLYDNELTRAAKVELGSVTNTRADLEICF